MTNELIARTTTPDGKPWNPNTNGFNKWAFQIFGGLHWGDSGVEDWEEKPVRTIEPGTPCEDEGPE